MFVWGKGHKSARKSVIANSSCPGCGRADRMSVVVDYDYSHIYWLFRFVRNRKTSLVCEHCGMAQSADQERERDLYAKLGGNPIPIMDRFGGVALLLIVAGLVAFSFQSQVSRDSTGAIVRAGQVGVFDIRVGDCFNDQDTATEASEIEVLGVNGVPCAQPHDNEVFAVFDLRRDTYPEDEALRDIATDECLEHFEPFVGRDYWTSSLDIFAIYPTRRSWHELNDREVVCILYDMELNKLQGSMKGSGI
jgi:hypothetical protein